MKEEDKKLILEWCGFGFSEHIFGCWYPDDRLCHKAPPQLDPNFYFKYAVPKLKDCPIFISRHQANVLWSIDIDVRDKNGKWGNEYIVYGGTNEDPAEAFGEALLKLIKEE